jgi:RNA polymerase sigma-70 factor (ECF subfamily)
MPLASFHLFYLSQYHYHCIEFSQSKRLTATNTYHEKELFRRIAAGDEQAFATIFHQYTAIIYPFVLKKVKSQAAAEEIVQDVFLKLWTKREMLSTVEAPAGYLMRIATNRTLDHLRRKAIEYRVMQESGVSDAHSAVENTVSFREAKRILDEAIAAMPAQRRTIYLLQQEGYSYEEIATHLGISAHTVRNHLAFASKYLKNYLREHGLSLFIILLLSGR